ncbi:MAG TPA: hypothetical protein VFJ72_14785, partial [Rubrobacteraceae bacterium]|nr:hypothetical protein [Rubrobacteraceae bacterium]
AMPTSTQITLGNDLDGNRKIACPNTQSKCEYITYRLSGATLLRNNTANASSGGDAVAENVKDVDGDGKALTFSYMKSNGTTATSESDIRIVRVKLEVSKSGGSFDDGTQTVTTDIALRNR